MGRSIRLRNNKGLEKTPKAKGGLAGLGVKRSHPSDLEGVGTPVTSPITALTVHITNSC